MYDRVRRSSKEGKGWASEALWRVASKACVLPMEIWQFTEAEFVLLARIQVAIWKRLRKRIIIHNSTRGWP